MFSNVKMMLKSSKFCCSPNDNSLGVPAFDFQALLGAVCVWAETASLGATFILDPPGVFRKGSSERV